MNEKKRTIYKTNKRENERNITKTKINSQKCRLVYADELNQKIGYEI